MSESDMTDAEIDELLERFDQTEPRLQRRIIAAFICDAARLRDQNADLLAACEGSKAFVESMRVPQTLAEAAEQVRRGMHLLRSLNAAIAKATGAA